MAGISCTRWKQPLSSSEKDVSGSRYLPCSLLPLIFSPNLSLFSPSFLFLLLLLTPNLPPFYLTYFTGNHLSFFSPLHIYHLHTSHHTSLPHITHHLHTSHISPHTSHISPAHITCTHHLHTSHISPAHITHYLHTSYSTLMVL